MVAWSAIARVERSDEATVRQWRKEGYVEALNTRTKQIMRTSTRLLDDLESNRERFDILGATSRLQVPLLLIHGEGDESVPVGESREFAARRRGLAPDHRRREPYLQRHSPAGARAPRAQLAADVTASFVGAYS